MKRVIILIVAVLALCACEVQQAAQDPNRVPSAIELTRIAVEMDEGPLKATVQSEAMRRFMVASAAESTAEAAQAIVNAAQAEAQAQFSMMTAEAHSIIQAQQLAASATNQALSARATSQALDAIAAQQARDAMATSEAHFIQMAATSTAQAVHATATVSAQATAEAQRRATATMQAAVDRSELTRVAAQAVAAQATAQAIERENEIAESRQALTTFGGWAILTVILVVILVGLVGMIVYLAPVIKARAQVVRRKHDETEPLVVTLERVTMPLRAMFPVIDHDNPRLPSPQMQDRTTARAQLANVISAARGGGRRRRATHRPGATRPAPQAGRGVIEVIEPERVRPWIEDARTQLIDGGVS